MTNNTMWSRQMPFQSDGVRNPAKHRRKVGDGNFALTRLSSRWCAGRMCTLIACDCLTDLYKYSEWYGMTKQEHCPIVGAYRS